mmetsp:Transcript_140186/g.447338  ORF Transcript_140186/g.447338 Transcript_140186/m.447338 type:complete len:141 (-) Transcript_140186:147-569(-)
MALPMKKAVVMKAPMKKAGVMKKVGVMKKAGAMKKAAMKKVKKVSKVARGKGAKTKVFKGTKEKTVSGLKKESLTQNKFGKVVSKKSSARAKTNYANSGFKTWIDAVRAARKALGLTGFIPVGGTSAAGKALYAKAKSLL